MSYDYLVLALGAKVELLRRPRRRRARLPAVHARRRGAAEDPHPRDVGGRRPGPVPRGRRQAQRRHRRGRPDRGRERRRARRALPRNFAKDYPDAARGQGADHPGRGGPGAVRDVQPDLRAYAKQALEKRGVEVRAGEVVASVEPDARDPEVRQGPPCAHARLGRRACRPTRSSRRWGSSSSAVSGSPAEPDLSLAGHPEVFAGRRHRVDHRGKRTRPSRSSARSRCRPGEHAGENIARLAAGKDTEPFRVPRQGHDGDDRPRRGGGADRGAAAR